MKRYLFAVMLAATLLAVLVLNKALKSSALDQRVSEDDAAKAMEVAAMREHYAGESGRVER